MACAGADAQQTRTPLLWKVTRAHGDVAAIIRGHGGEMGLRSARVFEAGGPGGVDKRDAGTLMCKVRGVALRRICRCGPLPAGPPEQRMLSFPLRPPIRPAACRCVRLGT